MEEMNEEDGGDEWKEGGEEEGRDEKKERQKEAPVNKERKKQGHLVSASVLTPNTLVPC